MDNKELHRLKNTYLETPIPDELDFVVKKALKEGSTHGMNRKDVLKRAGIAVAAVVVISVAILTAAVNTNSAFAATLSKVPAIGGVVQVLTFREYTVDEDRFSADIKVPAIEGLGNTALQSALNEKYLAENQKLYDEFMAEMADFKKQGAGNLGVDSGYIVKTDTDRILSVGRYVVITKASGAETLEYDTIDKINEVLITLPSLFKDDQYIEIISENIKAQMLEQMETDEGKIYWVAGRKRAVESFGVENFERISPDQDFYINAESKLVISFDEYEVAPGMMGVVEFIIPTDVISEVLVSNEYIK